ncbi:hypothetical protein K432DRAFT_333475 [Lepidopterella palustris CBS 459.81]|uniref:DNA replication checkpoint mediator MRC1 domain-containing protein n=1 Tax=Lepidopterella palustris CBS 459.81 TaxID=1314670 RepID=A0A8E2E5L0_9PEZI|nr:hypothetical protein K432DRAFT_333475 [Lepidopterella palustris CBS 459.81]
MSPPSSPTRSTRASSLSAPSKSHTKSPMELTPKSSHQRLLDQSGEDSDLGSTSIGPSNASRIVQNNENANPPNKCIVDVDDSDSDADDEDIPVQRPRGKIAARLLAQAGGDGSEKEDNEAGEDAYTRVKRMLLSGKGKQQPEKEPAKASLVPEKATSESEEDFPVRPNEFRRWAKQLPKSPTAHASPSPKPYSRGSSPGLFVSPRATSPSRTARSKSAVGTDSDPDQPTTTVPNARFQELVARKRAEMEALEEETRKREEKKANRLEALAARSPRSGRLDSDSDEDGEGGRRLTQQARPTRKASKKALEELSRETQRMNRNMQLAHQVKTKKKFGVKDLLARFNYMQEGGDPALAPQEKLEITESSAPPSDAEGPQLHDTPPTSPPSHDEHVEKGISNDINTIPSALADVDDDADLPTLDEIHSQPVQKFDKGKGRALESQHIPVNPFIAQTTKPVVVRNVRVVLPKRPAGDEIDLDSDDDLEIVKTKSRFPVFDRLPNEKNKDSRPLLRLRALAHLKSPGKQGPKGRVSMGPTDFQTSLQRRAREQAQKAREEKLSELRARGIIPQTEEERERDQLDLENLLEKAREEALGIAKKEKAAAKKDGTGDAQQSFMDSEDEGDGDWEGSGEEEAEEEGEGESDVELSGSEEDGEAGDEDEEEDVEDDGDAGPNGELSGPIDRKADEADEEEVTREEDQDDHEADTETSDDDLLAAPARKRVFNRPRQVIADDEDDSDGDTQKKSVPSQSTADDGMAAFGFDNGNTTSLGLTQMFAGTMANLQSQLQSQDDSEINSESQQDSLAFLRSLPATQPSFDATIPDAFPDIVVPNSQVSVFQRENNHLQIEAESQIGLNSQSQAEYSHTQLSDIPEPTQDVGFELSRSPAGLLAPPSTIDTSIMQVAESPIVKKKGRLHRRKAAIVMLSGIDDSEAAPAVDSDGDEEFEISANAFDVMRKAAKKRPADDFDKKKSEAKGMVEEQAEESEDEYAGLGGQSDDESGGELDEEVAKMIDESDIKVDERKIAAFYADKARAEDEKQIDKLYKDIHNGGLRRKRGNDFELSDSEDEAAQRRRKKQLEFAKMRKALLEDENIGKIAQNPKKSAFLRALEDRDDDPDLDFLAAPDFEIEVEASETTESISVPDSQQAGPTDATTAAPNPLKRKHIATDSQEKENRPPPNLRRTNATDGSHKPVSLAEIRESVSFLIDEPQYISESQISLSESSDEEESPRHVATRKPIIDRLTLSRSASAASADANTSGVLAFHASTGAHQPGFRVPSLIRRATSNLSSKSSITTSGSSSGSNAPADAAGVRRGGSGRSNIHYQAREAERRAALEKADERRRESIRKKVVKGRNGRSVLGLLDGGFE